MSWWDNYRAVPGSELRAAALDYAAHGWPVIPGSFWQAGEWTGWADPPTHDAVAPAPVTVGGVSDASRIAAEISAWWSGLPYSVLLATGTAVDAIEVPAAVGRRVRSVLQSMDVNAPIAVTPVGQWWFGMAAGEPLRPELASMAEVLLRSRGSWVVAPPCAYPEGEVQWRSTPEDCGWRLPDPYDVQYAVLEALLPRRLAAATARFDGDAY